MNTATLSNPNTKINSWLITFGVGILVALSWTTTVDKYSNEYIGDSLEKLEKTLEHALYVMSVLFLRTVILPLIFLYLEYRAFALIWSRIL